MASWAQRLSYNWKVTLFKTQDTAILNNNTIIQQEQMEYSHHDVIVIIVIFMP